MRRTFRPLQPLRGWRKVAAQTWRPPRDPSVYATLDIPMRSALAYLERQREETGVRVTVTHLVARGVALAIRQPWVSICNDSQGAALDVAFFLDE